LATRKRKYIDGDIEDAITSLEKDGWGPAQIHRHLSNTKAFEGRVPSERTVQRIVSEFRSRDRSGAWTMEDGTPEEAAAVFTFLAPIIHRTRGRVQSLSKAQVSYLVKILAVCTKIPPDMAFFVASQYVNRTAAQEPVDDLDAYLAFQPWRGKENSAAYYRAIDSGWIRPIPSVFIIDDDGNVTATPESATEWWERLMEAWSTPDTEDSDGE
jgi:hypothetical protein